MTHRPLPFADDPLLRFKFEMATEITPKNARGGAVVRLPNGEAIGFTRAEVDAIVDRREQWRPRHPYDIRKP